MRKALTLSFILTVAMIAPGAAGSTPGMDAMHYYVGTWSCAARPKGFPALEFTAVTRMDSGILREWTTVPAQGELKKPEANTMAMSYDAQKRQYVQTQVHFDGTWSVSVSKPWSGNTERWTDVATDNGKLGHADYVRLNEDTYTFTAYPHWTDPAFYFKGTCRRSSRTAREAPAEGT